MRQRLGIAAALLGDPRVLVFDEPLNGLDPEGILWIRGLLRSLADQGRTTLLSSHLMSEMALTADHLIVIGKGRLIADTGIADLVGGNARSHVLVKSAQDQELSALLAEHGTVVVPEAHGGLTVTGLSAQAIGELAATHRIAVHELSACTPSLEEAFMELTADSVEYKAAATPHEPS